MKALLPTTHADDALSTAAASTDALEVTKFARRSWFVALFIVLGGAGVSAIFIHNGIRSAIEFQEQQFDRHATNLFEKIESSLQDYEFAAAWIHESCRDWREEGETTDRRQDFRMLYNYIDNTGLDLFLAEWVPNITHVERPALEAESALYYADDTNVDYRGFLGLEPDIAGLSSRSNQPYYFPIQYLEPYENIGDAVHLDLYSLPYEQEAIDRAIETYQPVLTERFKMESQMTDGFSVSLVHPGVRVELPNGEYSKPQDLALLLIHIRSLLARAVKAQPDSIGVYLYDCINEDCDGSNRMYLGGAESMVEEDGSPPHLTYYDDEIVLEDVLERAERNCGGSTMAGHRYWRIVAVSVDDTYKASYATTITGGVVIFCASLLLAWIWIIHNKRRSKHVFHVINKAAADAEIVNNLFPTEVRDRLIQHNKAEKKRSMEHPMASGIPHSSDNRDMDDDDDMPIADEYPNTTVLFADLAGFTSWSSNREPQTVFKLLETLYGAFDAIAKKRNVFKVETIGDCYLAVTGIPNTQPKHAIIMTRFASECITRMREIVHDLAGELGEDTLDLQLRVGLHSGPVTAGVLRGEKARFQLFGDTVNTASRMESNGKKGRIHCSQDTADALVIGRKGFWLTPREEIISVKGKGEMQTYWITYDENMSTTTLSTSENNSFSSFSDDKPGPEDIEDIKNNILEARQRKRVLEGITETSAELRKDEELLRSDNVDDLIVELQQRRESVIWRNQFKNINLADLENSI